MRTDTKNYLLSSLAFVITIFFYYFIIYIMEQLNADRSTVYAVLMSCVVVNLLNVIGPEYLARARRYRIEEEIKTERALRKLAGE